MMAIRFYVINDGKLPCGHLDLFVGEKEGYWRFNEYKTESEKLYFMQCSGSFNAKAPVITSDEMHQYIDDLSRNYLANIIEERHEWNQNADTIKWNPVSETEWDVIPDYAKEMVEIPAAI